MTDDISKRLILVVLLITIVLSSFGTVIILQSSPASQQQDIPATTGRVAINIEPNPDAQTQTDIETTEEGGIN